MRTSLTRSVLLLGLAALLAQGCAQEVGDIDRTQPNKIEKAAFQGEWYFLQTVVDVNATAVTTFIGLQGANERIKFEIEENWLLAYRVYEDVPGSDSLALAPGEELDHGQPVAAFPITSHFDIQRQYNSSTGEQTNVIVENASDRHWYDRDYMRVDWTSNSVVTSVDPIVPIANVADISIMPQDQGEGRTWFVERNENGEIDYIDVLSTFVIEPDWTECVLTFGLPAAWGGDCGPETVTVRSSFARIDDDDTFAPREYTDYEMNEFGIWRLERAFHDQRYGSRDQNRLNLAGIYDMWEDSTRVNANGETEVIPYAEREPGHIVYYLDNDYPEDLKDDAFSVAESYDSAFRRIVAAHRGIDIPSDPRRMTEVPYDQVPHIFYLCENPGGTDSPYEMSNEGYRQGICQRPGQVKNIGDVRFSFFGYINHPQQDGPLGYGPPSLDPITGEIFRGAANLYGAGLDSWVQWTIDYAKTMTGELTPQDWGQGQNLDAYFAEQRQRMGGQVTADWVRDRAARARELETVVAENLAEPRTEFILSQEPTTFAMDARTDRHPLELLRGTELERRAIVPEMVAHLTRGELDPGGAIPEEWVPQLSLATIGDPLKLLDSEFRRSSQFLEHGRNGDCILRASDFDPAVIGLARRLSQEREQLLAEGMTTAEIDEKQWRDLRGLFVRGVLTHEVGHTVGLRHNFEGSYDSLNYGPEYWELRSRTFNTCDPQAVTFNHGDFYSGEVAPPQCQGSESYEEYTARSAALLDELYNADIHAYQTSSVMDYINYPHAWGDGLQLYDFAAIAYGYGELVEVFNQPVHKIYVGVEYDPATDNYQGSEIRQSDQLVTDFDHDVDEYFIRRRNQIEGDQPAYNREGELGHEHGYEYYHYSTLPIMFGGDVEAMYDRRLVPRDQIGDAVRVPYRFCEDYRRGSSIECNIYDQGADFLEIYQNLEDYWNATYFSRFFRRGRIAFGLWFYPMMQSMFSYQMAPMTRLYQHWLIRAGSRGVAWYNEEWGGLDASLAATAAIDFLGEIVTTPTIGTYYYDEDLELWMNLDEELDYRAPFYFETEENIEGDADYLNVDSSIGRYGFSEFRQNEDEERPYYYFFEYETVSWFWAKWMAMMALVLPEVDIIGVDTESDSTAFSIPIYLIFPEEMTTFFGAIPREDYDILGSCVAHNGDARKPEVLMRRIVSGSPSDCAGAETLNPYTDIYNHSDFNMRLLSILYGSAYFQSNYSMDWFDLSNVYILGRAYNLDPGDGFHFETYEHDNGVQFAALLPDDIDADVDENVFVGAQYIWRMQDLREARDAEREAYGESDHYWELYYDLENVLEDVRLLNQANSLFEGYNVFLPWSF